MVTGKGFYLDVDGIYKDVDDNEEIAIVELEHSVYGLIKYVVYDDMNHVVNWTLTEEYPKLPDDWMEEI
ncbi:MAG: hypothetical protein ACTSSE_08465 [Candidatus Thorarchaeota archaeon]